MSEGFWAILVFFGYIIMVWITRVVLDLIPAMRRDAPRDLKIIMSLFWLFMIPVWLIGWSASYVVTNFMKSAEFTSRRLRDSWEHR